MSNIDFNSPEWERISEGFRKYGMVSVSDFSRGQASRVFREIQEGEKDNYTVLKNNKEIAHILSNEEYWKLEKDSEIVSYLYDLASIEGKVFTPEFLIKKIDQWRENRYNSMGDWNRFGLDEMPEWQRERTLKAISFEEYAVPTAMSENQVKSEEIRKVMEAQMGDIRKAVEERIKSYLDEELERMIVEETRKVLNSDANTENEHNK